jgi:hypothetical protein
MACPAMIRPHACRSAAFSAEDEGRVHLTHGVSLSLVTAGGLTVGLGDQAGRLSGCRGQVWQGYDAVLAQPEIPEQTVPIHRGAACRSSPVRETHKARWGEALTGREDEEMCLGAA